MDSSRRGFIARFATIAAAGQVACSQAVDKSYPGSIDSSTVASVDLLSFIPPSEWKAIEGGGSNFDCTPALMAAVREGKRVILTRAGRYKFRTAYYGTTNFDVEARVANVEFDFSELPYGTRTGIQNSGSLVQLPKLSKNLDVGDRLVTFVSAPSLAAGDWFCIYNPTPSSWSGHRKYYNAGEWCQVNAVAGRTVTLRRPLYDHYGVGDVAVFKLKPVTCRIANIRCIGTGGPSQLVKFSLSDDARFSNMSAVHAGDSVFEFDRCTGGVASNLSGRNLGVGKDDYFLVVGNSQHIRVDGGDIYARRHAVATGGAEDLCNVPCRDIRIGKHAILRNDPASGDPSANFHGNTEDSSYEDCTLYGGLTLAGKDTYARRCKITGRPRTGVIVHFGEVVGGTLGVIDCVLSTPTNPQQSGRGIFNIGGNEITSINSNTREDVKILIRGCSIEGEGLSDSTSLVIFVNRGSSRKVSFEIQDINLNVNALGQVLYTGEDAGNKTVGEMVVKDIRGLPARAALQKVRR